MGRLNAVEVFLTTSKTITKEHREKDPKQCRGQDAALLNTATQRKGLRCTTIETACDERKSQSGACSLGGTSNFLQEAKEFVPINQVEGSSQVDEDDVQ
jgi:hypothetical protein